jgi:hypothetical protein
MENARYLLRVRGSALQAVRRKCVLRRSEMIASDEPGQNSDRLQSLGAHS